MQRIIRMNVPPNEPMVGVFPIPKFWTTSIIFKSKCDEMVIIFRGEKSS